jgi:hypothetical protein
MPDLASGLRAMVESSISPVDVDAIVRTRRRRRARRRFGGTAIVAVIAMLVTGGVLARPVHEPDTVSVRPEGEGAATDAVLRELTVISPGGETFVPGTRSQVRSMTINREVEVTDPRSGETRSESFPIPLPDLVGGNVDASVVRGASFMTIMGSSLEPATQPGYVDRAYLVSSALDRWKEIGRDVFMPLASVDSDEVWLRGTDRTVTKVSLDGNGSTPYRLTDDREPIAAVTGALVTLRKAPDSYVMIVEVWDPVTNRVVRALPIPAQLVAATGDFVVWSPNSACLRACPRHILDLRSGSERQISPPAGMEWDAEAQFAPEGRHVAFVAHNPLPAADKGMRDIPAPGTYRSTVMVVDGSSGEVTEHTVTTWKGRTRLMWSPDGALLFVARDDEHLAYFNTTFENSPVREVAVPRADAALVVAKPAPSATTQKFEYDGLVKQSRHHSPELCVYDTTLIGGPDAEDCAGPLIAGWDSERTSGRFHLVGTYNGDELTLTEPPTATRINATDPGPTISSGCETPPEGWQVTDANRVGLDDYTAVTGAARSDPEFAGLWFGPNAVSGGVTDIGRSVINVAFTGNLDVHRAQLAQLWGGPICVVRHPHAYADLRRIADALSGDAGRQLGLQVTSVGPDDVNDVVRVQVVAVTDEIRRAVDQRYGKGVVVIESSLQPVP